MSLSRNSAYNLVGQVVPLAVSLAVVPIYLRLIGVERYGVLAIAWLLLGYFGLFDFGLTRAASYRVASRREADVDARAETFWTAVVAAGIMSVLGAIVLYAGGLWYFSKSFDVAPALRQEALTALPVLALALPGAILTGVLSGALQGRERFLDVNAIGIASGVMSQLLPAAVAWLIAPNLAYLLVASVGVQCCAIASLWHRCWRHVYGGGHFRPSRPEARELFRFGGWITVSATVSPIMVVIDRFLIGSVINATAVAAYAVPAQLSQRVSMIPYALSIALFPRLSGDDDPARATDLSRMTTRVGMVLMTPVVVFGICAMRPFLQLWIGDALDPTAATVGQVLLVGWWVNGLAINPFALLQARGKPRIPALLHIAELPFYAIALFLLTSQFGLTGAAAAFSLRCAVDCLALNLFAYGRQNGLVSYAVPAALLAAATWAGAGLGFDARSAAMTGLLTGLTACWSWLALSPQLRQSACERLIPKILRPRC